MMNTCKLTTSIIFLLSILLSSKFTLSKEYQSLAIYMKENPKGKHQGTDGNWLKSDREKSNEIWNQANFINIKKQDGYLEYKNLNERCSFYLWFQHQTDSLGFKTRWPGVAASTARKLKHLLHPMATICGYSNHHIKDFVNKGSDTIFNNIWGDLKALYEAQPLQGTDAEIYDGNLLLKEQNLINPYFQRLHPLAIKKLERLLRKENVISRLFPGYEFEGNLLSISDRWFYGMKLMRYHPTHER